MEAQVHVSDAAHAERMRLWMLQAIGIHSHMQAGQIDEALELDAKQAAQLATVDSYDGDSKVLGRCMDQTAGGEPGSAVAVACLMDEPTGPTPTVSEVDAVLEWACANPRASTRPAPTHEHVRIISMLMGRGPRKIRSDDDLEDFPEALSRDVFDMVVAVRAILENPSAESIHPPAGAADFGQAVEGDDALVNNPRHAGDTPAEYAAAKAAEAAARAQLPAWRTVRAALQQAVAAGNAKRAAAHELPRDDSAPIAVYNAAAHYQFQSEAAREQVAGCRARESLASANLSLRSRISAGRARRRP
jgi:hypothetical protein